MITKPATACLLTCAFLGLAVPLQGNSRAEVFETVGITAESTELELVDSVNFKMMREKIEALGTLTEAPAVYRDDARLGEVSGKIPIYFDALDYRGAPTKVFGWLGVPEGVSNPMPGVVLVHGGGGSAFHEWVQRWNDRGYAALSIAVEGQTDIRDPETKSWEQHEWAGPSRVGIYGDSDEPLEDQWMYHAVANTILANSLLRSFPEVDADRVGVMGISWGGVITSTVMGIDDRFAFVIPVYGCGGLDETENQYGRSLSNNEVYKQAWDPNLRLPRAQMPSLWLSWPGDQHFPLDRLSKSADLASGSSLLTLVPGMGHGHGSGWNRPESYAFADSVVQSGKAWCAVFKTNVLPGRVAARFQPTQKLDAATLVWTADSGPTGDRTWSQSPANLKQVGDDWIVTADLPPGATACFLNVASGDLTATSDYLDLTQ